MKFQQGERVRVRPWPEVPGLSQEWAGGTVAIISSNQKAIAVGFMDDLEKVRDWGVRMGGGIAIHPEYGVMLLAVRREPDGVMEPTIWDGNITMSGSFEIEPLV